MVFVFDGFQYLQISNRYKMFADTIVNGFKSGIICNSKKLANPVFLEM